MNERFLRTEMILGAPALDKLRRSHVAVFGLGGVGSYAAECLARSGVGTLTLVDQDTVSVSNINRQLCALTSTVGQYKAEVAAARVRDIDPDTVVYPICATYDAAHRDAFFTGKFDYIADCIDLVTCKLDLIQQAAGISRESARMFHLEMWIYVHGIAAMAATSFLNWDTELISASLTDAYRGLLARFKEKEAQE